MADDTKSEATYQQRAVDITDAKLEANAKRNVLEQDLARELQAFRRLHADPDHQRLYREFFRELDARVRASGGLPMRDALRALLVPPATVPAPTPRIPGVDVSGERNRLHAEWEPLPAGVKLVPYGPGHEYATREDAEKAMQRGHVNGCALETDHAGGCFGPSPLEHQRASYGEFKTVPAAKGETSPVTCLFSVHGKGVCHLPHGHKEDHWFGAPALSPRQALGEALACVDRALSLIQASYRDRPSARDSSHAGELLKDSHTLLRRAYEAAT